MFSKLRLKRQEKRLSQCDLFKKTNVGPWRISQFERGLVPHMDEAEKIAKALGANVNDIFPEFAQANIEQGSL